MTKPSSFCTICTSSCTFELIGFLLSLSIYHPNVSVYIMCDTETKKQVMEMTPMPKLNLRWYIELDKYTNLNRNTMDQMGIWSDFQMSKANIMLRALEYESDVLFLDSDMIIMDIIDDIDVHKELGVSKQYIVQEHLDKTGLYNGGMLWTKHKQVPYDWIEFTKTSRYYDQASIEDLVQKYDTFLFPEHYNVQCWRYYLSGVSPTVFDSYVTVHGKKLYYKNHILKSIHTHLLDPRFSKFNQLILHRLIESKSYTLLLILYRIIHKKWIIKIPKQPIPGIAYHKNDSFRELCVLLKVANKDVDIQHVQNTIHCWLEPNILLYDRPTLEWINPQVSEASLFLLGNGDVNHEGKYLSSKMPLLEIKPWIFWPRRPMILEKILKKEGICSFSNRTIQSIFIGNIENKVQETYRHTNIDWSHVIQEYHCTSSTTHKFTHEEYLMKIRESKYGLCLRGYGSKCHREVELMAFGTVPIITQNVSIVSYMNPPIENIHYIRATSPKELESKITSISQETWEFMSKSCYEWYQNNIHSSHCWSSLIENILYA